MLEKKNVFKLPPPETILVETAVINKNLKKKKRLLVRNIVCS